MTRLRSWPNICAPETGTATRAVHIVAENGPDALRRILLERGRRSLDRSADGDLSLALEGGHTLPHHHAADATGKAIEPALLSAVRAMPTLRRSPNTPG